MRASTTSFWVLLAVSGCASAGGRTPDPGGRLDGGTTGDAGGIGGGGADGDMAGVIIDPPAGCSDSAKLVYLLDSNNSLWSFQPNQTDITKSTLTLLGSLSCATSMQPNAMAVDRTGVAWIEYVPTDETDTTEDQLFKVDVTTMSCKPTSYATGAFGTRYGMAFVADAPMSTAETLFVAKGDAPFALGKLDTTSLTITTIGAPSGGPELTGTGDAHLWAFFPDPTMPRVSELDKQNAGEGMSYPIPQAMGTEDGYAFAFWGGDFWVFLKKDTDAATVLYHVRGSDGAVTTWPLAGRWIIGAGVSTCAPTTPIG
jgi:hypothetical protein